MAKLQHGVMVLDPRSTNSVETSFYSKEAMVYCVPIVYDQARGGIMYGNFCLIPNKNMMYLTRHRISEMYEETKIECPIFSAWTTFGKMLEEEGKSIRASYTYIEGFLTSGTKQDIHIKNRVDTEPLIFEGVNIAPKGCWFYLKFE